MIDSNAEPASAPLADSVNLPVAERIKIIDHNRWVGYTRAGEILDWMSDLIRDHQPSRRQSLLVLSESDNGKSALLRQFEKRHPGVVDETGRARMPVVRIDYPSDLSESRLYGLLLDAVHVPHNPRDPAHVKEREIQRVFTTLGVRAILMDEFSNVLNAGPVTSRKVFAVLRNISNALNISFIAAGTRDAIVALRGDQHLFTRFEVTDLPLWTLSLEFRKLVSTYIWCLPLQEKSTIAADKAAMEALFQVSAGKIGPVVRLLNAAAIDALKNGEECITLARIKAVQKQRPSIKHEFT